MSIKSLITTLAPFFAAMAKLTPTTLDDQLAALFTAAAGNEALLDWLDSLLRGLHTPMSQEVSIAVAGAGLDVNEVASNAKHFKAAFDGHFPKLAA